MFVLGETPQFWEILKVRHAAWRAYCTHTESAVACALRHANLYVFKARRAFNSMNVRFRDCCHRPKLKSCGCGCAHSQPPLYMCMDGVRMHAWRVCLMSVHACTHAADCVHVRKTMFDGARRYRYNDMLCIHVCMCGRCAVACVAGCACKSRQRERVQVKSDACVCWSHMPL